MRSQQLLLLIKGYRLSRPWRLPASWRKETKDAKRISREIMWSWRSGSTHLQTTQGTWTSHPEVFQRTKIPTSKSSKWIRIRLLPTGRCKVRTKRSKSWCCRMSSPLKKISILTKNTWNPKSQTLLPPLARFNLGWIWMIFTVQITPVSTSLPQCPASQQAIFCKMQINGSNIRLPTLGMVTRSPQSRLAARLERLVRPRGEEATPWLLL